MNGGAGLRVLGIDEAGRGCVLGDLFIGGFLCTSYEPKLLTAAGATDSKRLSVARRLRAREQLSGLGEPVVRRIRPDQIDTGNLNDLEESVIVDLVRTLRPALVILDALGAPSTLPRLRDRLAAAVAPHAPRFVIEPKADLNHPVCGAASIFAKTARDEALDELRAEWGVLGSGYPSDPKTRAWLTEHAAGGAPWPHFVRTRWGTVRDIEGARAAQSSPAEIRR